MSSANRIKGTKIILNSVNVEQINTDILSLSGATNINGSLIIESGATLTVKDNAGVGKILISDSNGILSLQMPNSTIQPYLSLSSGSTVTWDVTVSNNMMLTIGSDFTLVLNNLSNGMSGDLRLNVTSGLKITLPTSNLNGDIVLAIGIYHLAWTYAGSYLDINIANYM